MSIAIPGIDRAILLSRNMLLHRPCDDSVIVHQAGDGQNHTDNGNQPVHQVQRAASRRLRHPVPDDGKQTEHRPADPLRRPSPQIEQPVQKIQKTIDIQQPYL